MVIQSETKRPYSLFAFSRPMLKDPIRKNGWYVEKLGFFGHLLQKIRGLIDKNRKLLVRGIPL